MNFVPSSKHVNTAQATKHRQLWRAPTPLLLRPFLLLIRIAALLLRAFGQRLIRLSQFTKATCTLGSGAFVRVHFADQLTVGSTYRLEVAVRLDAQGSVRPVGGDQTGTSACKRRANKDCNAQQQGLHASNGLSCMARLAPPHTHLLLENPSIRLEMSSKQRSQSPEHWFHARRIPFAAAAP